MQDLKNINYQMVEPTSALKDLVQCIWFADNYKNEGDLEYKILSDCGSGLVMNFGDELIFERNGQTQVARQSSVTVGPSKKMLKMTFRGAVKAIGIHFYPETGFMFYQRPISEFTDSIIPTQANHFTYATALYQSIANLQLVNVEQVQVVRHIEKALLEVIQSISSNKYSILGAMLRDIKHSQIVTITELSDKYSLSIRDIQRLFKKFVGVTPKAYMQVNRVRQIKHTIAEGEFSSHTQLSLDKGYFDQAHFIRESKMLMEVTPSGYCKLKRNHT